MTASVGIVCFVLGLYVGKKRAKGLGWGRIGKDLCQDVYNTASTVISAVAAPFRKEKIPAEKPSGQDD